MAFSLADMLRAPPRTKTNVFLVAVIVTAGPSSESDSLPSSDPSAFKAFRRTACLVPALFFTVTSAPLRTLLVILFFWILIGSAKATDVPWPTATGMAIRIELDSWLALISRPLPCFFFFLSVQPSTLAATDAVILASLLIRASAALDSLRAAMVKPAAKSCEATVKPPTIR